MRRPRQPRHRRLLRFVVVLSYGAAVFACFVLAAYFGFTLMVRSGVLKTPDVTGLTEAEAIARLAEDGLVGRRAVNDVFDPVVDIGRVARHVPDGGTYVKRGSTIELALSLGRQLVRMPDLRGQPVPSAQAALASAALELGATPGVFTRSSGEAPGTVLLQDPPGGGYVDRAIPVALYVGLDGGPANTYVMPDFVARSYEATRRQLESRGFRLGNVKVEPYEGVPGGVVLRQFPLPGHPLRTHDAISLVVSAGGLF